MFTFNFAQNLITIENSVLYVTRENVTSAVNKISITVLSLFLTRKHLNFRFFIEIQRRLLKKKLYHLGSCAVLVDSKIILNTMQEFQRILAICEDLRQF